MSDVIHPRLIYVMVAVTRYLKSIFYEVQVMLRWIWVEVVIVEMDMDRDLQNSVLPGET